MPAPDQIVIRRVLPDDDIAQFTLAGRPNQPLRQFLNRRARQFDQQSLGRTFVLVDIADAERPGRIWGYLTLVASQTDTTDGNKPDPQRVDWPSSWSLPSVKLARMAIDDELRGKGWGRSSIQWVIAHLLDNVCRHIGCRLLITDAKQQSVNFYQKLGFALLDTPENKGAADPIMFIDLLKL